MGAALFPQGVAPDEVKLLVIENLMLLPSADIYLMPFSYVDYRVERRKHGRTQGPAPFCVMYLYSLLLHMYILYSRKIWRELNLAVWPQPAGKEVLEDFNLVDS